MVTQGRIRDFFERGGGIFHKQKKGGPGGAKVDPGGGHRGHVPAFSFPNYKLIFK